VYKKEKKKKKGIISAQSNRAAQILSTDSQKRIRVSAHRSWAVTWWMSWAWECTERSRASQKSTDS